MPLKVPSFAGLAGALFDYISGTDQTQGIIPLGKLVYGPDGSAPVAVGDATGLPTRPRAKVPDTVVAATALNMAVDTTQAVAVTPAGMGAIGGEVAGAFTGTMIPEVQTVAGGTWDATSVIQRGTGLKLTAVTGPLRFIRTGAGAAGFRLRCSVVGTGAPTVAYNLTHGSDIIGIECGDPARNLTTAVSQLTAPQVAPAVSAAAYTTGQVIGGLLQFTAQPASGYLNAAAIVLASGTYGGTIDLLLFSANPTASTVADHGALVLAAADVSKLIGIAHLTDTTGAGVAAIVQATGLGQPYVLAGTTIYAVAVVRGAVTLAATTDMTATLQVVR